MYVDNTHTYVCACACVLLCVSIIICLYVRPITLCINENVGKYREVKIKLNKQGRSCRDMAILAELMKLLK